MGRFNVKREKKPLIVICSEGGRRGAEYYYFKNFSNRNLKFNPHSDVFKITESIYEFIR